MIFDDKLLVVKPNDGPVVTLTSSLVLESIFSVITFFKITKAKHITDTFLM